MNDSIGMRLKARREAAGLDRSELSELAGLSFSLVGMIERGDRTNIAAATAIALARVLGTTAEHLITGDGDPPTPAAVRAAVESARAERDRRAPPPGATHTASDFDGPVVDRSAAYDQSAEG